MACACLALPPETAARDLQSCKVSGMEVTRKHMEVWWTLTDNEAGAGCF